MNTDQSLTIPKQSPRMNRRIIYGKTPEDFRMEVRQAVLNALDEVTAGNGWIDNDLPDLFLAIDRQADRIFDRYQP